MENDILTILEIKTEDPLIKDTQKLLRLLSRKEKKEIIDEQIEKIKIQLDILIEKAHPRVKEIYNNHKINEENLEFALKLTKKDKEIYKELEEIKRNYRREIIKIDIQEIIKNIENLMTQLNNNLTKLKEYKKNQSKKSVLLKIKNKFKNEKNEKLEAIFKNIIETLEKSKEPINQEKISENFFIIKDEYFKQEQMKEIIDRLYKKCRIYDSVEVEEIINEINNKLNKIKKNIENQLERINKEPIKEKKYDERLLEYVYDKKRNYISHSIDHSETNKAYKNILTILKLISELEKGNSNIIIPQPKKEESKQEKRKIR